MRADRLQYRWVDDGRVRLDLADVKLFIEAFDPKSKNLGIENWESDFESVQKFHKWTDKAKILNRSGRLEGIAKLWYHGYQRKITTCGSNEGRVDKERLVRPKGN